MKVDIGDLEDRAQSVDTTLEEVLRYWDETTPSLITELLETGSVTFGLAGRKYIATLSFEEVKE